LTQVQTSLKICVCGLPCPPEQSTCDFCQGKHSVQVEGYIYKKLKADQDAKAYWLVLLGKELYTYRKQGATKHKEMKSLTGVYLKSDLKEEETNGTMLYPFMLIFPDKKRLYFLKSPEEKAMWVNAIKQAIGHANILTYYEVGEVLGKGKYGTVR
jgi:hypothetical protein